ncbi:hypothetical protein KKG90_09325 [Candidatus Bipolaricaulota bacterium]|nr:hypothetical protein [Candidatus Bipolaricaulota bacterium]
MSDDAKPIRPLSRLEKLLIKLRRCPLCRKRIMSVPQDQIGNWDNSRRDLGTLSNSFMASSYGRSRVGHVTQFRHRKIPHCPGCQCTFTRGWIYPVK